MTDDASLSGFGLYEDLIEEENHVSKHQVTLENADLKRRLDLAETSKSQLEKKNETLKEQVKSLGKNLYDLWLAARKELAAKDSELEHLTNELKSYRIVICPSCDTNFQNSNSPPAKPQYVKILRSKNTVELQFHDYEKLNNWIKRVGLTKNSDGLPTLPEAVESLLALKESNSLTFVAKEIMNEKVRSARKSPSAQVQTCSRHRKVSTSQRQSVVTDEHSRDMVAELRIDTTQSFVRIISNESGTEEKRTATGIMEKKSISNCKALDSGRAIRSTTQKPQERQQNSRDRSNHERTRNQRRSMETRHCHSPGSDHRLTRQVLNHRDSRAQIPLDRKNGWDGRDVNDNVRRGKDQRQSRNRQNLRRSPRKDYSRTTGTSEANSQLLYREQTKSLTDIKDPAKSKTKKSPEATTPDKNSGLSTRDVREKNKKISVGQEMQIENSRKEGEVSCEQEGIPVVPSSKSCSRDPSDNREKPAADCEKGKSPPTESPIIIPKKKMTYESYIKRKQLATEAKDSPATSALPDEVEKNTNENLAQAGMPFVVAPCINEWERYYEGQISPLPPTPVKVASAPVAIPQSPLVSVNPLRNSLDFGSPTPESPHLFKSPRTTPLKSLPVKKRLEMFAIDQRKAIGGLDGVNDCHSLPGNDGTMSSVLSCGRAFHIMQEWLGDMNVGASVLETSPIKKLADSFAWKLSPIKPPNRESIDQQKTPEAKKQSSGMSGNVEAESSYPIEAISFKKMLDEQVGLAEGDEESDSPTISNIVPERESFASAYIHPGGILHKCPSSSSLMGEGGSSLCIQKPPSAAEAIDLDKTLTPGMNDTIQWEKSEKKAQMERSSLSGHWQEVRLRLNDSDAEDVDIPVVQVVSDISESDADDIPLAQLKLKVQEKMKLMSEGENDWASPNALRISEETSRESACLSEPEINSSTPRRSLRCQPSREFFGQIPQGSPVELDDIEPSLSATDVDLSNMSLSPLKTPVKAKIVRKKRRKRLTPKKRNNASSDVPASLLGCFNQPVVETPTKLKANLLYCGRGRGKTGKRITSCTSVTPTKKAVTSKASKSKLSPVIFYRKRKKTSESMNDSTREMSPACREVNSAVTTVDKVNLKISPVKSPLKELKKQSSGKKLISSPSPTGISPKRRKMCDKVVDVVRNLSSSLGSGKSPLVSEPSPQHINGRAPECEPFVSLSMRLEGVSKTPEIPVISEAPNPPTGAVMPSTKAIENGLKPVDRKTVWKFSLAKMKRS